MEIIVFLVLAVALANIVAFAFRAIKPLFTVPLQAWRERSAIRRQERREEAYQERARLLEMDRANAKRDAIEMHFRMRDEYEARRNAEEDYRRQCDARTAQPPSMSELLANAKLVHELAAREISSLPLDDEMKHALRLAEEERYVLKVQQIIAKA